MEIIFVLSIIFIIAGVYVGSKYKLDFWLHENFNGLGYSILIPLGVVIALSGEGWVIFLGIVLLLFGSSYTFQAAHRQTYGNRLDTIILALGKIGFATITFGILVLISLFIAQKSTEKRNGN